MTTPTQRPLDALDTLRALVRHLRDGVFVTDADGRLLDANPAFVALVGAESVDALVGRPVDALVRELAARHHAVRDRVETLRGADGAVTYLGIATERADGDAVVRDPLTGAFTTAHLSTLAARDDQWGVLYVDVDGLGAVNRRHGRDAGDDVLVRMARFLMRHVRADEPVVRLANDEFVVVLGGATDQRTERVARRLQLTALRTAPAAFSLGWSVRVGRESLDALIDRAAHRQVQVRVAERVREQRGRVEEELFAHV